MWHAVAKVAPELELTHKVAADKEGSGPPIAKDRGWKEFQKLSPEDATCSLLTSRLTVTLEVVRVVPRWHRVEEQSNHTTTNVKDEAERLSKEPRRVRPE